ncbi:hypothetical protein DH2020_025809 [Rehmannia glutinosa]|uniref:Uncharacterized protein n=1 Tax=Rehmannia glutinosa TaxID=99300 RepID=A0ABR0W156_REHGL
MAAANHVGNLIKRSTKITAHWVELAFRSIHKMSVYMASCSQDPIQASSYAAGMHWKPKLYAREKNCTSSTQEWVVGIATQNELIKPPKPPARPISRAGSGFLKPSNEELPVKNLILQRCFVDLVTGDSRTKQQAAARFDDIVGQNDTVSGGEQPLLLPRRFRKHRAWLELKEYVEG